MAEDLNNLNINPILLDAAVIMTAADLLFPNEDLEAYEAFIAQSEKENLHKITHYFEAVIPMYSLSGK